MKPQRILSVGQCWADHSAISRTFRNAFSADVISANTLDEALELLGGGGFALVLVNRVFDADGTSGLELIQRLKSDTALAATPIMLVSNYAASQAEAERAGAVAGFGKNSLGDPTMLERVRPFLDDG